MMTITLTTEIEKALAEEARKQGTTPELLALHALHDRFIRPAGDDDESLRPGTLADFLAGHIGVLASGENVSGGANMSTDCGKKFAAGLVAKRQGP